VRRRWRRTGHRVDGGEGTDKACQRAAKRCDLRHPRRTALDSAGPLAVGHEIHRTGHGHDSAVLAGKQAGRGLGLLHRIATIDALTLACTAGQRDDLGSIAANDGRAERQQFLHRLATEGCCIVGDRIEHPWPASLATADAAAARMPLIQSLESVPILMVSAPEMAANSPASSSACTMAGEAPAASSTLAAMFIATKLVMH
jgi:hypothetical protein